MSLALVFLLRVSRELWPRFRLTKQKRKQEVTRVKLIIPKIPWLCPKEWLKEISHRALYNKNPTTKF